jgi:Mg2+ and Co2+ transporter CorA
MARDGGYTATQPRLRDVSRMDVRLVTDGGVEKRGVGELQKLLKGGEDGLIWVDIPAGDSEAVHVLSEVFRFHPLAVNDAVERNRVRKMHGYQDHVFVILHAPERGKHGHVHYIELDQFIGVRYLVTVHGPLRPSTQTLPCGRPARCSSGSKPDGCGRSHRRSFPTPSSRC